MPDPRIVNVEVHGQRYPIRTTLDPSYVQDLATFVDRKMSMAMEASPSSDMLGLAVLTALNIADELFRTRDLRLDDADTVSARASALEHVVDQALALAGHNRE